MRTLRLVLAAALLAGCGGAQRGHIDAGVLGSVVVYRNGVAFYRRDAHVTNGRVTVHVPRDRVDDFLKSLTVVDAKTKEPLVVSIPRQESDSGSYLTMTLETPGVQTAEVQLTYVTESPAWKPSYRIVVGDNNKVMLEGWAIVDNTTSEDWKGVLVGVGASSALAFRYDLWSVRQIDRDLLEGEEKFAIAPPTAVSPYAEASAEELISLDAEEVRKDAKAVAFSGKSKLENQYYVEGVNTTGVTYGDSATSSITGTVTDSRTGEKLAGVTIIATGKDKQTQTALTDEAGRYSLPIGPGTYTLTYYYADLTIERSNVRVADGKATVVAQKLDTSQSSGEVVRISDSAPTIDPTGGKQSISVNGGYIRSVPVPGRTFEGTLGKAAGSRGDATRGHQQDFGGFDPKVSSDYRDDSPPPQQQRNPVKDGDEKLKLIATKVIKDKRDVLVEVRSPTASEKEAQSRAAAVKNKLVDDGVPAKRVHVRTKVGPGEPESVRVLAVSPQAKQVASREERDLGPDTPVGESHFIADKPMTVRAGSSAMVSMVRKETTGGVVYLYDPISERGDQRFAFKAVRLDNPTGETLEPGPVTVYGKGRFIGEGITEAVLPHASVVVPFALDKQVVVSRNGTEEDRIAKIITVQRGVMTAEVQHRRQSRFTVTSRATESARVYLRHRLESGWVLVEAPSTFTKVGDSQLFEIELGAGETKYVNITEATPVQRTFELGSTEAIGMMKLFVDEPDASPQLRAQIAAVLATHRVGADLEDKIATLREQLVEYRSRSGELNAQLVTLKVVRTSGELMATLRTKLAETSERVQKTTISLVETQEQLMLTRVKFQNQLADLKLTDATKPVTSSR